jgi:hypothetical protein
VILRVKHQAFRTRIASGRYGPIKVNIEGLLGGRVKLPLHCPVSSSRRNNACLPMRIPEPIQIGKGGFTSGKGNTVQEHDFARARASQL